MNKEDEKKPLSSAKENGGSLLACKLSTPNVNTNNLKNQENSEDTTQIYRSDGDYQMTCKTTDRATHWTLIVYADSAPSDWIARLQGTGLPFVISPYHDRDVNPDGTKKKAHWHVIVSYDQAQRYSSVIGLRDITQGPYPAKVISVGSLYAYLNHKHNPEKYQYSEQPKTYNGWTKVLENHEITHIKQEITKFIFSNVITEYSTLIAYYTYEEHTDYLQVIMNNTVYFDRVCGSLRYNPLRALRVCQKHAKTDAEKQEFVEIIEQVESMLNE